MKLRFRSKLFINISVLLTLIAIIFSLFFYLISLKNLEENDRENSKIILDNTITQIDSLYSSLEIAAHSLANNPQLKKAIYALNNNDNLNALDRIEIKKDIETNLNTVMFSQNISNVFLFNSQKNYLYYTGYYLGNMDYIYKALSENYYSNYTSNVYLELPPHSSGWRNDSFPVISVIKNFSNSKLGLNTLIEVQSSYKDIYNICSNLNNLETSKEIFILDNNLNVVCPLNNNFTLINNSDLLNIKSSLANGHISSTNNRYSFISSKSEYADLTVVLYSNNDYLNNQRNEFIISTLAFILVILIATILVLYMLIKKLSFPLNQLIDHINSTNLKDNSVLKISDEGFDEFQSINKSFNNMVKKFNESVDKICEAEVREANANFFALQAQINPHFLYNTLNAISAASEIYGSDVTTKMCHDLSMMMRYTTSNKENVSLIDEINHSKNYLELMNISCDGDFSYKVNLQSDCYDIVLPKLIIQPLVENCFKHAFKSSLPPWVIEINCTKKNNTFKISIKNNGDKFSKTSIDELNKFILDYNTNKNHETYKHLSIGGLGLKNIYARLKLMYDDINFSIHNLENGSEIIIEKGDSND